MGEKYVIDKATLDDIGDAIREKSGSTGSMTGSAMAGRIRAIELGVKLPSLSNPAVPGEVVSGKEYIDGDGVKQTGSHVCPSLGDLLPALSNPATAAKIFSGYQAINGAGQVMTGSAGSNITNAATAAKIATGFQALDKAGNLLTGTGTLATYAVKTGTITAKTSGSVTAPGTILLVLCEGSDYAGGTTPNAGKQVMTHWYSSSSSTSVRKFVMSVSGKTFTYDGSAYGSSSPATLTYYIVYKV